MATVVDTTTISNLIGPITGVMVPLIGATVLSIVNFINHHVHTTPTQQKLLDRIAALEGKAMVIDQAINSQKDAISAFAASDPTISSTVSKNQAQITAAEAKITQLTDEISKLKAIIPAQ